MTFLIERVTQLPADGLAGLVAEGERAGHHFVRRLIREWEVGINRFKRPGEGIWVARAGGQVVGVCGLNVDPFTVEPRVGRVRHLYILESFRRVGVGKALVRVVIQAATGVFDRLRLRTVNPEAARFYERMGFHAFSGDPNCTHLLDLPVSGRCAGS